MKYLFLIAIAALGLGFTTNKKQGVQLDGTYESKKGVMHNASCHGNNIGILTLDTDERIVICFDEMPNGKDIKIGCKNISVEGQYRQHKIAGGEGPCKAGTLTILYVQKWYCNEE